MYRSLRTLFPKVVSRSGMEAKMGGVRFACTSTCGGSIPKTPAPLAYKLDALAPYFSAEQMDYHFNKHYQGYHDTVHRLMKGTQYEFQPLVDVVRSSAAAIASGDTHVKPIFNAAAQIFNHSFFWECLSPGEEQPNAGVEAQISKTFGSMDNFKQIFSNEALNFFGSGWVWLYLSLGPGMSEGNLVIKTTRDGDTPIVNDCIKPILVMDLWEHAYYIDCRNRRAEYIDNFWKVVNWRFVAKGLGHLYGEVAQKGPTKVKLEAGKEYAWCSCGTSTTEPFCDMLSHVGSSLDGVIIPVPETKEYNLCSCKQTRNPPFCDGTHKTL